MVLFESGEGEAVPHNVHLGHSPGAVFYLPTKVRDYVQHLLLGDTRDILTAHFPLPSTVTGPSFSPQASAVDVDEA